MYMYIYVLWLVKSLLMFISVCKCLYIYVYVLIVYMLCSPMLEEIKNLSIYPSKRLILDVASFAEPFY